MFEYIIGAAFLLLIAIVIAYVIHTNKLYGKMTQTENENKELKTKYNELNSNYRTLQSDHLCLILKHKRVQDSIERAIAPHVSGSDKGPTGPTGNNHKGITEQKKKVQQEEPSKEVYPVTSSSPDITALTNSYAMAAIVSSDTDYKAPSVPEPTYTRCEPSPDPATTYDSCSSSHSSFD